MIYLGFQAPTEVIPRLEDFEDQDEYLREGIAWINRNLPGAPAAPGKDDPDIQQAIADRLEELSVDRKGRPRTPSAMEVEKTHKGILARAQLAHVKTWLNGWKGGSLIRFSADGQQILSMVRIGPQVGDMAVDGQGRFVVAAATQGVFRFESDAKTISSGWPKLTDDTIHRVDADKAGYVVALGHEITVLDPQGKELSKSRRFRRTIDVAISSENGLYYLTGYNVTRALSQVRGGWKSYPVHIANLQARTIQGDVAWTNYDWRGRLPKDKYNAGTITEENAPDNFLNKSGNNMADTRGERVIIGDDGLLYASFEAAGGNHIFFYEPKDIMTRVGEKFPKMDGWHQFTNTTASHKGIVGRFDPKTGEAINLQQFNTVVMDGRIPSANAFRMAGGDIWVDDQGALFLTGNAATGLPIKYSARFSGQTPTLTPLIAQCQQRDSTTWR